LRARGFAFSQPKASLTSLIFTLFPVIREYRSRIFSVYSSLLGSLTSMAGAMVSLLVRQRAYFF
jgi:hypothetical protein